MNTYVCQTCGAKTYSAARYENLKIKTCEQCGGPLKEEANGKG